jgi:hypothetical protein
MTQIFIFIVKVTVLSVWDALSDERSGLSLVSQVVGSRSLVSIYIQTIYLQQLIKNIIHDIYTASVSPGSV